jgi:hypothetical protein
MIVVTIAKAWPAGGHPFTVAELGRMPDDGIAGCSSALHSSGPSGMGGLAADRLLTSSSAAAMTARRAGSCTLHLARYSTT